MTSGRRPSSGSTGLAATECHYWQILPLGPTGYGDSPVPVLLGFAGNPYLVASQPLLDDLLVPSDVGDRPQFSPHHVDYGRVIPWKLDLLDRAFDRFPGDGDVPGIPPVGGGVAR